MIVDFTVSNFRSFKSEQTFSMNVEGARKRLPGNYTLAEDGKLAVLRSAAIVGPNASGKSNLLRAFAALRWLVRSSGTRGEGKSIPPYEPYRLARENQNAPIRFEVEFIVPSGIRYAYTVAFLVDRITEESLYSFANGQKALVFQRDENDTWEMVKFGGTYKGGKRKFPFFQNNAYLARAGGDASAPGSIREIYRYFDKMGVVAASTRVLVPGFLDIAENMAAVGELICLADTGVSSISAEKKENTDSIKIPLGVPNHLREAIIEQNRVLYKFSVQSTDGEFIQFDEDAMSEGTVRLFQMLPVILIALARGAPLLVDELDAHFHPNLLALILKLFHDDDINKKGAQIIFTAHDTNVLNSKLLRRDQIWFVSKDHGTSSIRSLDEYDKQYVRPDSPFDVFYMDGRLGALPRFSYDSVKATVLKAISPKHDDE